MYWYPYVLFSLKMK